MAGPLRQEADSLGLWTGWAQGASKKCRRVGSVQQYFQKKGHQRAPHELPGVVGRKHDAGSDSSFHNMLGSLSQNHEIEKMRKKRTLMKMRMRRKKRRTRQWLQWWQRWL